MINILNSTIEISHLPEVVQMTIKQFSEYNLNDFDEFTKGQELIYDKIPEQYIEEVELLLGF